MTNFIEEFYYSNIDPQARSFEQNKKVQHDMQILPDTEDFLTDSSPARRRNDSSSMSMLGPLSMESPPSTA